MSSFTATAGRIVVRNDAGAAVFDTDERLFTVTDVMTGSVTLPQRTATYSGSGPVNDPIDIGTRHYLGACNAAANIVRGGFKVSVAGVFSQGAVTDIGTFNANGTYMHYQGWVSAATREGTGEQWFSRGLATFTFLAEAGGLYLYERSYVQAQPTLSTSTTNTTILQAPTFIYQLLVGTFV